MYRAHYTGNTVPKVWTSKSLHWREVISKSVRLWRSWQTSRDSSKLMGFQIQTLIDKPRRLPSGMSILSGRPDPSNSNPEAKLPPSIEEIDHVLKKGDEDPKQFDPHGYLHLLLTRYRLSSEKPITSELKPKPGSITLRTVEGQQKQVDQQQPRYFHNNVDLHHLLIHETGPHLENIPSRSRNQGLELSPNRPKVYRRRRTKRIRSKLMITPNITAH